MFKIRMGRLSPAGLIAATAVTAVCVGTMPASASSHRERRSSPSIPRWTRRISTCSTATRPGVRGTSRSWRTTCLLQDLHGGPNYFFMDPDAIGQIHIDNNGDAKEDMTFEFKFGNNLKGISLNIGGVMVPVPLIQVGQVGPGPMQTANLNIIENYTVNLVRGDQYTGTRSAVNWTNNNGNTFRKPVDNIGNKTIPDYAAYANGHVYPIDLPGSTLKGRMFVGQPQGPVRGEPGRDVRPGEPEPAGVGERREGRSRRRERDIDHSRAARELRDGGRGSGHRAIRN